MQNFPWAGRGLRHHLLRTKMALEILSKARRSRLGLIRRRHFPRDAEFDRQRIVTSKISPHILTQNFKSFHFGGGQTLHCEKSLKLSKGCFFKHFQKTAVHMEKSKYVNVSNLSLTRMESSRDSLSQRKLFLP